MRFFIASSHGGVLILFAFFLPFIIILFSFAFDGSRYNILQARQIDAIQQASLSVAVSDVSAPDSDSELERIRNYLRYYIGDNATDFNVGIEIFNLTDKDNGNYQVYSTKSTSIIPPMIKGILTGKDIIGFNEKQKVMAPENAGLVRVKKGILNDPADYVFVIDFSHSMNNSFDQTSPDETTEGPSKLDFLKQISVELMGDILDASDKSTVGIVPYAIGVMTWDRQETNQVGGTYVDCSFSGVVKEKYKSAVDNLWFWHNKTGIYWQGDNYSAKNHFVDYKRLKSRDFSILENRLAEASRWSAHHWGYYNKTLSDTRDLWCSDLPKALKTSTYDWLAKSCDYQKSSRLLDFTPGDVTFPVGDIGQDGTLGYFVYNENNFRSAIDLMIVAEENMSVINTETFDYERSFSDGYIFKKENIISYPLIISPNHSPTSSFFTHEAYHPSRNGEGIVSPFRYMCQQDYYTSFLAQQYRAVSAKQRVKQNISPNNYIIELTNSKNDISELKTMKTSSGSDSTTGLLRALPVISQGVNKRKVIVVISDGLDIINTDGPFSGKGPGVFSDYMHKSKQVCVDIKDGLKKYSANTSEVDMYFISLASKFELDEALLSAKKWENYCVGEGNSFTASDYDSLRKALLGIGGTQQINYINSE